MCLLAAESLSDGKLHCLLGLEFLGVPLPSSGEPPVRQSDAASGGGGITLYLPSAANQLNHLMKPASMPLVLLQMSTLPA